MMTAIDIAVLIIIGLGSWLVIGAPADACAALVVSAIMGYTMRWRTERLENQ